MEKLAREGGAEFKNLSREKMETLWDATKKIEREPATLASSGVSAKR